MAGVAVDLTCRPLVVDDLPAIMEIEAMAFEQPWSEALFGAELGHGSRRYVGAMAGTELCGYGGLMLAGEDATVLTLAVAPQWREQGVASRLLLDLMSLARDGGARHVTLEVRESNAPALDLYGKFGFERAGRRPGYYTTEDALIMWALDIDSAGYQQLLDDIEREAQ